MDTDKNIEFTGDFNAKAQRSKGARGGKRDSVIKM
jgi:hypothetical protein